MALAESGAPYGPGLDAFGLAPERLLTVAAARPHDLLWAMEEALRCRAIGAVIGELRHGEIDMVTRRLSLAAAESGALALLLRAAPPTDASTAATRWIVGAASNACFAVELVRNRRGPLGSWILEWSDSDERFLLATPAQPVAAPALDRPHRQVAWFSLPLPVYGERAGREGPLLQTQNCGDAPSPACRRPCASNTRVTRFGSGRRPLPARGERWTLVVYGKRGNAELIVAVDEAAEQLGLHTGLALAQARAMHPTLQAIEEDAEADAALLEKIADWCLRYYAAGGGRRARRLAARHRRLRASLRRRGRAGCRSGRAHRASGLYLHHRHRRNHRRRLGRRAFWRAGKLCLRRGARRCWRRCRFPHCGFRRRPFRRWRASASNASAISSICRAAPLTARFGGELLRQLDRALGAEHEPLNPRLPVAPYVAEQRFAEPIAREQDVLAITVARLAARLQFALERRGDGARRIELTLFRTDGECAASPPAARARCAIRRRSARCSSSGWRRSPTNSIPASASTWRGCR